MTLRAPSLREIEAAAAIIDPVVVRTPLVAYRGAPDLASEDGHLVLLKPEIHQVVGSFKIRGVFHAVATMSEEERQRGLLTVSAGNTAQALAWAGRYFGVEAHSLMPEKAPTTKIEAVRALGGQPRLVPTAEVFRFLKEEGWRDEPYSFVHPWIDRRVIVGHGTLGLEIADDLPDIDTVFVSVGGGGLIAGTASALKKRCPKVRVIAVEPRGCPALHQALQVCKPVDVDCQTICDGIAVPYITEELFPLLHELVDEVVLIHEEEIRRALRDIARANRMIVEPSAAITVAAAMQMDPVERGRAVCVVSGGSVDESLFLACLGMD